MKRTVQFVIVLVALVWYWQAPVVHAEGECEDPKNLTVNCEFATFSRHDDIVIADGWWYWIESGNPAIDQGFDSPSDGVSQRIWTDGIGFVAGLYQQVDGAVPGVTYRAGFEWVVHNSKCQDAMNRQVGLDPTGGIDPNSPTVVWSPPNYHPKLFQDLNVSAVAQAETLTIFVRIDNSRSCGRDLHFIDYGFVVPDESVPVQQPATATPTLPPPTATSLPATATPVPPTFTPAPTETPTPAPPTTTPTQTPTATDTVTPPATSTHTATPTPAATETAVPEPTTVVFATLSPVTPTPAGMVAAAAVGAGATMLLGSLGLILAGIGVFLGWQLWQSRRTKQ